MTHEQRIEKWLNYADEKGISKKLARPVVDKVLLRLGYSFPPFVFWKFPFVALLMGLQFAFFWGLFMYLTVWRDGSVPIIVFGSLCAGGLFGCFMAGFLKYQKKKWNITSWEEFYKLVDE